MSVVVVIKKDKKIYLGADTQATRSGCKYQLNNLNNLKVWKVNHLENCFFGHAGRCRDACAIKGMDNFFKKTKEKKIKINYEFVVNMLMPAILEKLKSHYYVRIENDFLDEMESSFIFVYKDSAWLINSDCSVMEIEDYFALGSGSNEAIGSLITSEKKGNIRTRIVEAVKAASRNDIYVGGKIAFIDSSTNSIKIIGT